MARLFFLLGMSVVGPLEKENAYELFFFGDEARRNFISSNGFCASKDLELQEAFQAKSFICCAYRTRQSLEKC